MGPAFRLDGEAKILRLSRPGSFEVAFRQLAGSKVAKSHGDRKDGNQQQTAKVKFFIEQKREKKWKDDGKKRLSIQIRDREKKGI